MQTSVDINCDLGEGCSNDAELMKYISSANIACGYHAGDADTMRRTVELAIENNVAPGAHPSFPDRENFGRTNMALPPDEVFELVSEQIFALKTICDEMGVGLHHVKAHGALYNIAVHDRELARAIARATAAADNDLILFGLPDSYMIAEAEAHGLRTASEVFADRTYQPDGILTPRTQPNALIENIDESIKQVIQVVRSQSVVAVDGSEVKLRADTICIHGDGAHAVEFAKAINNAMRSESIEIRPT